MVMLPPLPNAPFSTKLLITLPKSAILISSVAFSVISPATVSGVPKPAPIPALRALLPNISTFWALIVISPPPAPCTNTPASLVSDTEARVTLRGNFKLRLSPLKRRLTFPDAANPPNSTLPP